MKKINNIIYVLLIILSLSACNRDFDDETTTTVLINPPSIVDEVRGDILGVVYDELGNGLADVEITIYSAKVTTDINGGYHLKNIPMDGNGTFILAQKAGYTLGSDMVFPSSKAANSAIQIFKKDKSQSFKSADGGEIKLNGGASITFTPNSVVDSDGKAYNGNVFVKAKYLNPNENIADQMPGDLTAEDREGRTVALGSAGMILAELYSDDGSPLNLAPAKTASVKIPVQNTEHPTTISTWSYDFEKAKWIEEGTATIMNNFYEFEASHFSFWNCDAPFPLIKLKGRVLMDDIPIKAKIKITTEGLMSAYGTSNEDGVFCGKVPKGKKLTIEIFDYCDNVVESITVGSFTSDTDIGDIAFDSQIKSVEGVITCGAIPVANPIIYVSYNNIYFATLGNENGEYLLPFWCLNIADITLQAINELTNDASTQNNYTLTNGVNTINIDLCDSGCNFSADLIFDCNFDNISASLTGGNGPFTYSWTDGSTGASTSVDDAIYYGKPFCVTVTDASGCTDVKCVVPNRGLGFEYWEYPCGTLNIILYNGVAPFTVTVEDLNGNPVINENGFDSIATISAPPGFYKLTVMDANGCFEEAEIELSDIIFFDQAPTSCNEGLMEFSSSSFRLYTYFGTSFTGQNFQEQSDSLPIVYDVLNRLSFEFNLTIYEGSCDESYNVKLPYFAGLDVIKLNEPTCATCEDGNIEYTVDNSANCRDCVIGSTQVWNLNRTDVTALNNSGQLAKGIYYVVSLDQNTNCVISVHKVQL